MSEWATWRKRFKDFKKDHRITDADIAAKSGIERVTVNSYLNKRDPGVADFMAMCEAAGADPGRILFEIPTRNGEARPVTEARRAPAGPLVKATKHRRFKQNQRRLRRIKV